MNINFSIKGLAEKYGLFSVLKDKIWIAIDWLGEEKTSLIFKSVDSLLLAKQGVAEKISWETVGPNLIVINKKEGSFIFKIKLFDENIIVLKSDSENSTVFLVNELLYLKGVNSNAEALRYLTIKYPLNNGQGVTPDNLIKILGIEINVSQSEKELNEIKNRKQDIGIGIGILLIIFIIFIIGINS